MVPLFIFSLVMVYLFAQNDRVVFQRAANQRTLALLTAVDTELNSSVTKLEALATSRHLEENDLKGFRDDAARVLNSQKYWFTINLSAPSGRQVMNLLLPPDAPLPDTAERESHKEVLQTARPAVGRIVIGPATNQYEFSVRVPVIQNGVIQYILSAVIGSDSMSALFARQRLPPDWIGVVLDGNKNIVTRTMNPEQFLGKPASASFRAALDSASEGWFEGTTLEDRNVYTAYNRSGFSGWTVAIGIPAGVVEASFHRSLLYVASFGVMFLACGIALAWFLSIHTARSIKSLANVAADLGSGKAVKTNSVPDRIAEVEQVKQSLLNAGRLIHERSQERDRVELALRQVTERLELAQVAGNIGTFERDLVTEEIKWSTSQERLYGLAPGGFGGKHEDWAKHVHPEDIAIVEAAVLRARETIGSINIEFRVIHPDGAVRWLASQARVFSDDKGAPSRMLGVNIDITERKQTEIELMRAKEHLAADLHAMNFLYEVGRRCALPQADMDDCLAALLDAAIAVTNATKGNIQLFDPSSGDLKLVAQRGFEEPFLTFFAHVKGGASACGTAMQRRERVVVEEVARDPILAGSPELEVLLQAQVVTVQSTPLVSSRGQLLGMISTHFDRPHSFAERDLRLMDLLARQAGDFLERKQSEEALRDADRRKDEFLAVLGHELRNPLGVISTAVQLQRRKNQADAELQEFQETIARQVAQMASLLDDLLDVARIGRGQVRLKKEPCNFTEIVRKTVEDHRGLLQQNGLSLTAKLPDEAFWVMGDATRLAQIVGNALQNANKFTDPRGSVTIRLANQERRICILTVQDTGIGMDPAMLARAFEPFSQADHSIERSRGGLGLGLALVKGLVELQEGQVNIASKGVGMGVELTMRFPLIEAPAEEGKLMEPANNHARLCRILIIEDNQVAARSTRMFLAGDGHIVEAAHDGQSGIETARRFHPQVVLCDIGLPGLDGYAVCRALRQDPELKKAYLIAITGYGQQDDQVRAREAGFDFHLTKPIDLSELERILAGLTLNPSESGTDVEKRTVA